MKLASGAGLLVACILPAGCAEPAVKVTNLAKPGSVSVSNSGPAIQVKRRIVIEQKSAGKWVPTDAYYDLIGYCGDAAKQDCRELKRGTIEVVPWNGYSCSGQCVRPCRSNSYLGPGTFRFVVVTCDGKQRFEGAPFELPSVAPGAPKP